jgi:predicted dehydrogenase
LLRTRLKGNRKGMKIGLIGCGYIAGVHAETFGKVATDVKLVAVSRTEAKARQNVARLRAVEAIAPYEAAFRDDNIEAVFICTAHHAHVGPAIAALEAGKHVYLEKPVARSVEEARPVFELAQSRPDQVVAIGEQYQLAPPLVSASELIATGALGKISSIVVNCLYCVRAADWRLTRETMGGGALIDGGIHEIHGMRMLGGEIDSVFAREPKDKWNQMEGEETIQLLVRFESGASGSLTFSWGHHGDPAGPEFLVLGSKASLAINMRSRENILSRGDGVPPQAILTASRFRRFNVYQSLGYWAGVQDFLRCIQSGKPSEISLVEGLRDLRVIEAAYRSLTSGREEKVASLPDWVHSKVESKIC